MISKKLQRITRQTSANVARLNTLDSDDLRDLAHHLMADSQQGNLAAKTIAAALLTLAETRDNPPPDVIEDMWEELHRLYKKRV